jgi:PHP family Zn ribbon phosphoesterase
MTVTPEEARRVHVLTLLDPSSTVSALIRHKMLEFSKDFEPRAAVRT